MFMLPKDIMLIKFKSIYSSWDVNYLLKGMKFSLLLELIKKQALKMKYISVYIFCKICAVYAC